MNLLKKIITIYGWFGVLCTALYLAAMALALSGVGVEREKCMDEYHDPTRSGFSNSIQCEDDRQEMSVLLDDRNSARTIVCECQEGE